MRVAIVSPNPGTNAGGVERFCEMLGRILRDAGWATLEVGPHGVVPRRWARAGVDPIARAASAVVAARRAKPDLVVSSGFLGGPTGTPRIHVFHGTMVHHVAAGVDGRRRYRARMAIGHGLAEALAGRGADTVVAVSRSTRDELWGSYRQRVSDVIPYAVDTARFVPGDRAAARVELGLPADCRIALFVGRPEYRKGFDLVEEACRRAEYRLAVAGAGAPASAYALGVLDPDRLAVAYRAADCLLFPSRYESAGIVSLEAAASRLPIVGTRTGWAAELAQRVPAYRPLIVEPELGQIVDALRAATTYELDGALTAAREIVLGEHGVAAIGSRWTALASKLVTS